jgi:glycosyltransferase involved in cell wall biosynthesis
MRLRDELDADMVYYLHDLIPIDYPEYVRTTLYADLHAERMVVMAKTGGLILANSHYTCERFRRFCHERGLNAPPCEVLEIGVEGEILEAAGEKRALPPDVARRLDGQPYFAAIGTIEPRKNHLLLLQIWRQLAEDLGEGCPKLVLVGRRGWENENVIDMLDRCPAMKRHVIELNDASDQAMIPIIQHALVTLYPSFEEGWGIPVTESLALGTPVICADIPALRECSQGKATFLHPLDGMGWMREIRSVAESGSLHRPSPGMQAFKPMTWQSHLDRLDRILESFDTE